MKSDWKMIFWLWMLSLSVCVVHGDYAKVVSLYGNITGANDMYKDLMTDAEHYLNNDRNVGIMAQGDGMQVIHRKSVTSRVYEDQTLFQAIRFACNDVENMDAIALIMPNDMCPRCWDLGGMLGDAYSPVMALDQADGTAAFKMRPNLWDIEEMITGVIDHFKWTTFIMLYEGHSGNKLLEQMMSKSHLYSWAITPIKITEDLDKLMVDLRTRTIKNVMVYASEETLLKPLFKTAFESGLLSTGWHWMFGNLNPPISKAFLEQKYRHSMSYLTRFKIDANEHTYYTSNQEAIKKWPFRQRAAYDALIAVAMALKRHKARTGQMPVSNRRCGVGVKSTLEEDLRQINFKGASGMVSFNDRGDRVNFTVNIYSGKDQWAENELGFYAQDPQTWEQVNSKKWPGVEGSRLYIKAFRQADSTFIKVVAVPEPPIFMQKNWERIRYNSIKPDYDNDERFQGMGWELLKEIKKVMEDELHIDFTFEVNLLNRGQYGTLDLSSGEWDGMVKELEDGNADIAVGAFVSNGAREKAIDFTTYWYKGNIKLLMLHPSWSFEYPFAVVFPYHWDAWMALLICGSLTSCLVFALAYFSPYEWRKRAVRGEASEEEGLTFSFLNSIFFVLSTGFWMGYSRGPKSWSVRILSLFWFMFAMCTVFMYGAMLNRVFKFSKTAINVKDEHDLLYQDQFQFGVVGHSPSYDFYRYNNAYYPKMIFDRMMTSDDNNLVENRLEDAVYRVRRQWDARYTLLGEERILKTASDRKPCRLFVGSHSLGIIKFALGVTSGSPLRDQLTHVIKLLKKRGVLDRIANMEFSRDLRCKNDSIWETQSKDSITIHDAQGPYYMLAIGITCSFIIFVIEWMAYNILFINKWKSKFPMPGRDGGGGMQTNLEGAGDDFGHFYDVSSNRDAGGKGASALPFYLATSRKARTQTDENLSAAQRGQFLPPQSPLPTPLPNLPV